MNCPILVDPVVWNHKSVPMQISLQAENYVEIKITLLSPTSAYSLHGIKKPITLKAGQTRRRRIKIKHLDKVEKQEDIEQKMLGEIHLHFRLEQCRVAGQALQYPAKEFTCPLTVQSPYAYPLNNPSTLHTRHTTCSCRIVELSQKKVDLPEHCIRRSHDAGVSTPEIDCMKVSRQVTVDDLINNLATGTGQKVIWFHGWPGCGKTTLLQDLSVQPDTRIGNWIPILMPIVDENRSALETAWQFMWEIDQRIQTVALQAPALQAIETEWANLSPGQQDVHTQILRRGLVKVNPASAIDALNKAKNTLMEKGKYSQDPYLKSSREFHANLSHILEYKNCRLLFILDGFYHFEDRSDEIYLNLARWMHLLKKKDSFKRFTLLVTDVMNFDERLAYLEAKEHCEITSKLRNELKGMVRNIAYAYLNRDEVELFFTQVFGSNPEATFLNRLIQLTRHPVLLKAILHQAKWLYTSKGDAEPKDLVLSRCLAQQLRQRYYQQGILDENENRVLQMLLDGENPRQKLVRKIGRRPVDKAITGLQNKKLVTPQVKSWWPVEETK